MTMNIVKCESRCKQLLLPFAFGLWPPASSIEYSCKFMEKNIRSHPGAWFKAPAFFGMGAVIVIIIVVV
jgi:hypothetical protein